MANLNLTAYFTENGTPKTGLTPTLMIWDVSDGSAAVTAGAFTELAGGWYKYAWAAFDLTKDYVARADGGGGQPVGERYAPIDMAGAALSGKIDSIEAKVDTLDGIVDSILEDTGTTLPATLSVIQAKTDNLKDSWNDIAVVDILDAVVESTLTVKQALAVIISTLAHKADGGGSTVIAFRNLADDLDRISMSVNEAGDRSAVVLDVSDL